MPGPGVTALGFGLRERGFTLSAAASARLMDKHMPVHAKIQAPIGRKEGSASTLGGTAKRSEGPFSTTYDLSWHPRQDCVCEDGSPVTGWGHQAKAALVDYLVASGENLAARGVAACSSFLLGATATINQGEGGKRHIGGLNHCGRMLCPVCAPYLMARRLEALESVAAKIAADPGLRHFMAVLTLRHHLGGSWKVLVKALRKMQTGLRQGHQWRDLVEGYIRLLESTFGRNGHNPHEHLIISVRADEGWNPEEFFAWIQALCDRQARKAGRTTEWKDGWWSEIPRDRLLQATRYLAESDKMGTTALREAASAATKHQPIWTIPAKPYAEIYTESRGTKWFGTGGCWSSEEVDKTDEELNEERQDAGQVVAHILGDTWKTWTPKERRDRLAVITDKGIPWADLVPCILTWGVVLGPPPDPWPGEEGPP